MSRPLLVLRPNPGNAATMARIEGAGLSAISLPLFEVAARAWQPSGGNFDALLLTSANAVRFGGDSLASLRHLPVLAVGAATAAAARDADFRVILTGANDAQALLAEAKAQGTACALHLGGIDTTIATGGIVACSIPVYASEPRAIMPEALAGLGDAIALVHSARAAKRFLQLIDEAGVARGGISVAAISPAVAAAAGVGWRTVAAARTPDDGELITAAAALAERRD